MKKFFIIFFLILTVNYTFSCNCIDKPSIEDAWKYSRQIFIGKVIEVNPSDVIYGDGGGNLYTFTIEIEDMIKGELYKKRLQYVYDDKGNTTISTDTNGFYLKRTFLYRGEGSCDFWFEKGKKYLIYSYVGSDFLRASECSRTEELSKVDSDEIIKLKELSKKDSLLKKDDLPNDIPNDKVDELNLTKEQLLKSENENKRLKVYLIIISGLMISMILIVLIALIKRRKRSAS